MIYNKIELVIQLCINVKYNTMYWLKVRCSVIVVYVFLMPCLGLKYKVFVNKNLKCIVFLL